MKDNFIHIRISEKDKESLKRISEKKQMTMSEMIVYLIRREAEKEGEKA